MTTVQKSVQVQGTGLAALVTALLLFPGMCGIAIGAAVKVDTVSPTHRAAGSVSASAAPNGEVLAAWGSDERLGVAARSAGGNWTPQRLLGAGGKLTRGPVAVATAQGVFHVVAGFGQSSTRTEGLVDFVRGAGSVWAGAATIDSFAWDPVLSAPSEGLALADSAGGSQGLAWSRDTSAGVQPAVSDLATDGVWGPRQGPVAVEQSDAVPSIARTVSKNGDSAVAWVQKARGSSIGVWAAWRPSGAGWGTPVQLDVLRGAGVGGNQGGGAYKVELNADAAGRVTALWNIRPTLRTAVMQPSGEWGPASDLAPNALQVSSTNAGTVSAQANWNSAITGTGQVVAAWSEPNVGDANTGSMTVVSVRSGTAGWSKPQRLETPGDCSVTQPAIGTSAASGAVVMHGVVGCSPANGLVLSRLTASGKWTSPVYVATGTRDIEDASTPVVVPTGRKFTAVWRTTRAALTDSDAKRYRKTGASVIRAASVEAGTLGLTQSRARIGVAVLRRAGPARRLRVTCSFRSEPGRCRATVLLAPGVVERLRIASPYLGDEANSDVMANAALTVPLSERALAKVFARQAKVSVNVRVTVSQPGQAPTVSNRSILLNR